MKKKQTESRSYTKVTIHPDTYLLADAKYRAKKKGMSLTKFTEKAWESYIKKLNK